MKKLSVSVTVLVLTLSLFTGCGCRNSTPAPTTEATMPTMTTTVPTTEAATVPTTEAEETVETTEVVPTQPDRERTGSAIGMAIVVMVLSALGLGTLIFGRKRSRGGKYSR